MKLQHGTNVKFDFPSKGFGKSGYAFYAYKSNSNAMRQYYDDGNIDEFNIDDEHVVDLTSTINYSHAKCWIENQLGKKITKEVVILDTDIIENFKWIK